MTGETVAFWSGHANSSAMVSRMIETKQAPDMIVHACTRAEFDFVYDFMEKFQKKIGREIVFEDLAIGHPEKEFINFFNKPWCRGKHEGEIHGMPKSCSPCWHNRNVKQPVFNKYENLCKESYTGFHILERHRCTRMKDHHLKRYPLIEWGWSAKDSVAYLRKREIPHAAYDIFGFERLGCWYCPKQSDTSLFIIYKNRPDLFVQMLEMEENSPHGFRDRKLSLRDLIEIWEKEPNYTFQNYELQSKREQP